MTNNKKKDNSVSITALMTVYNGESYLHQAIDSILNQTFSDFEFIIVDDGSTDNSLQIIQSYDDERIIVVRNQVNQGVAESRNLGVKSANGKYIIYMDADDISLPNRFIKQFRFMENNPDVDVCGSARELFGDRAGISTPPLTHWELLTGLLWKCNVYPPTVIQRRSTLIALGELFNKDFDYGEFTDFLIRLSVKGIKFANIDEVLLRYRWHANNVSRLYKEDQMQRAYQARLPFFNELRVSNPESKIKVHAKLINGKKLNKNEVLTIFDWINELIEANNLVKFFPENLLKKQIAKKWFNVCINSCQNGLWVFNTYKAHKVSSHFDAPLLTLLKFYFKCILKTNAKKELYLFRFLFGRKHSSIT